jgi:hypothetical protein
MKQMPEGLNHDGTTGTTKTVDLEGDNEGDIKKLSPWEKPRDSCEGAILTAGGPDVSLA